MGSAEQLPCSGEPGHDTFPGDVISHLLRRLVRWGGLLEPHDHAGIRASLSEVLALGELSATSGLSQLELGEALGLEKSTVSRLVAGLEHRGWVDRRRDPANRRYVRLGLTLAGADVAARLGAHFRERHRALLGELSAEEINALRVGLSALDRVIRRHHGTG
ncbi:MAG TPA: MarR family transcriptional regulator [Kineosporiaceae bacterium]